MRRQTSPLAQRNAGVTAQDGEGHDFKKGNSMRILRASLLERRPEEMSPFCIDFKILRRPVAEGDQVLVSLSGKRREG